MSPAIARLPTPLDAKQRALVAEGMDLVDLAARRLAREARGLADFNELVGMGHEGLIEAAVAYDPEQGSFEGFAAFRVRGAMLDGLRRRVSDKRHMLLAARKASCDYASGVAAAGDVLRDTDGQSLAKLQSFSDGVVASMFAALASAPKTAAVDELFNAREAHHRATAALSKAKASLPRRDRRLLELYYEEQRSLREVAVELSISYAAARKLHTTLLDRLARKLKAQGVRHAPPVVGEAG